MGSYTFMEGGYPWSRCGGYAATTGRLPEEVDAAHKTSGATKATRRRSTTKAGGLCWFAVDTRLDVQR